MQEIDRKAVGQRIKTIRQESGLRQWELARLLGATQSAVHKYEHGIVPEPRRLLEIARLGDTSVEWILSGRHGEGGTGERSRVPAEVLRTAELLRRLDGPERQRIDEALRILDEAAAALGDHPCESVSELLTVAKTVRDRVLEKLLAEARSRLDGT